MALTLPLSRTISELFTNFTHCLRKLRDWDTGWRHRPKMTTPIDLSTMASFNVRYKLYEFFERSVIYNRLSISAARGMPDRKWCYHSISWSRLYLVSRYNYSSISHFLKCIRLFRLPCKMFLTNFGEKIFSWKKLSSTRPQKAFPWSICVVSTNMHANSVQWSGP